MSRKKRTTNQPAPLRVPLAEQLLVNEVPSFTAGRVLCTSLGRGQLAQAVREAHPETRVVCHFFDLYHAVQARQVMESGGAGGVTVLCAADFPDEEFDLVAIPVDPRGDGELTRDLLQMGHQRLALGGRLLSATSNREDQWLHDEMRKLFSKVTRQPFVTGVLYGATKSEPLKKVKKFSCEFAFRDRERLIRLVSRPGVFSHRQLDRGARALINTMEVGDGFRVLDMGSGSGGVALAAAVRAQNVLVVGIDSHARAVEALRIGAELNGLSNVLALHSDSGECLEPRSFDLVVGNPPYFSDYRIAGIFLDAAHRALKPEGRVLMVTKTHDWFAEKMGEMFDDVTVLTHKLYFVVSGIQR